jgi:hypothetical protein
MLLIALPQHPAGATLAAPAALAAAGPLGRLLLLGLPRRLSSWHQIRAGARHGGLAPRLLPLPW